MSLASIVHSAVKSVGSLVLNKIVYIAVSHTVDIANQSAIETETRYEGVLAAIGSFTVREINGDTVKATDMAVTVTAPELSGRGAPAPEVGYRIEIGGKKATITHVFPSYAGGEAVAYRLAARF